MTAGDEPPQVARLTKQARREQLLDAAAELVAELGASGVTVERVAARAGVSKALPYAHFENAADVLVALHRREIDWLGQRLVAAIRDEDEPDDQLRAVIHAFFDAVAERGPLLGPLIGSGSPVSRLLDRDRTGPQFTAAILRRIFGLHPRASVALGAIVLGAANAAVEAWGFREAGRRQLEQTLCEFVLAGVKAVAED